MKVMRQGLSLREPIASSAFLWPAGQWAPTLRATRRVLIIFFVLIPSAFSFIGAGIVAAEKTEKIRAGFFSNITHAQAMVGQANGFWDQKLGKGAVEWTVFNAGPSVIEAMFANHLDIAYVGPSPAVNGYVKSNGEVVRILAGAASGGAAVVVREDAGIQLAQDFHGKKITSPQFGNTQDVALRSWLLSQNLKIREKGGDVDVLPVANADQLSLFSKKEIDASWSVEPWVSIYLKQGGTKIFMEESSLWPKGRYATTVVIVRKKFLDQHPEQVRNFLRAHRELTDWINGHPKESKELFNNQFEKFMRRKMDPTILDMAWKRVVFTTDQMRESVLAQAQNAYQVGFLKKKPDLKDLFLNF